jgi:hypothetical protein
MIHATNKLKNTDQEFGTLCKACITVTCHGLHAFDPPHGLFTDLVIPSTIARLQQATKCVLYADGLLHTLIIGTI